MKIKILKNPYDSCALIGLIFNAERNIHGAYGVLVADIYAAGVDHVFNHSETVFFPSRCIEVIDNIDDLEKRLAKSKLNCAQYYKWYQGACERIEKLKGELENERRKNGSSDTK